jgi:aspartyl-tRNA(Asn)/glutamyl-tRNA(Gln) amidotransferase subunit A
VTEAWQLSATEALAQMRRKVLSPVELLASVQARADVVEPMVNALTERRDDDALAAAAAAAERYATGEDVRPLEGLPVALKEEVPVAGWRMRYGSLAVDEIADGTAPIAERILAAGAVVHARTTTPEFSCTGYTHSKLWGVTRNPWNLDVAVGGSSGGSGASLASGTSTLASGSDIGGSIRIPASINGVVGFKAPHGRVPTGVPYNLDRYCHDGVLARTIADAALFENVVAGPHPADIASLRPKVEIPERLDGIDGMRIAVSVDLGSWEVDDEVAANTRAAGEALLTAGAKVDEVDIPWNLELLMDTARRHFAAIFGAEIASAADEARALMNEPGSFLRGLHQEAEVWAPIARLFETYDALICPTWAVPGIAAGDSFLGQLFDAGGGNDRQFTCYMTTPFNILAPCPVLAVPSGVAASNGVPTGIQIVARTYDDVTAFRIGAALEQVRPWTGLAPFAG